MLNFVCSKNCYNSPSYEVEKNNEYKSPIGDIYQNYEKTGFEFHQYDDVDSLSVEELREIADFMEERWKTKFRVGDNVTVNNECSNVPLRGLKGSILHIEGDRCSVFFISHGTFSPYESSIEYNG